MVLKIWRKGIAESIIQSVIDRGVCSPATLGLLNNTLNLKQFQVNAILLHHKPFLLWMWAAAVSTWILCPPLILDLIKEGKEEGCACTLHSVQCAVCSVQYAPFSAEFTLYSEHCTLCTKQVMFYTLELSLFLLSLPSNCMVNIDKLIVWYNLQSIVITEPKAGDKTSCLFQSYLGHSKDYTGNSSYQQKVNRAAGLDSHLWVPITWKKNLSSCIGFTHRQAASCVFCQGSPQKLGGHLSDQ